MNGLFGFGKKGRTQVGAVSGFGKVPALGDFVRTPGASEEAVAFETWLTRAMEDGEARGGVEFRQAYAAGSPHSFVWSGALNGKARGVLAGVVVPSHDAVGRRFPITVCAPLPIAAFAGCPHLVPIVLDEFFRHAAAAAARAARAQSSPEFNAQIAATAPPSLEHAPASAAAYTSWAKARLASDVWADVFSGTANAELASKYALYMLVESTSAYRGQDAPPLSLGIRVPLGDDARMGAAMWVDLARNAARWKANVPSLFWPVTDASAALILLGAEAPLSVLTALWEPARETDSVCDVAPNASSRVPSELPALVQRALADPTATISSVASELGS